MIYSRDYTFHLYEKLLNKCRGPYSAAFILRYFSLFTAGGFQENKGLATYSLKISLNLLKSYLLISAQLWKSKFGMFIPDKVCRELL